MLILGILDYFGEIKTINIRLIFDKTSCEKKYTWAPGLHYSAILNEFIPFLQQISGIKKPAYQHFSGSGFFIFPLQEEGPLYSQSINTSKQGRSPDDLSTDHYP